MVGFVMASYGCATTISALVTSRIAKYTGRYVLFSFAAAVNLAIFVLLYVWVPTENQKAYVFAMAVMWGLGERIWQTQSNGRWNFHFSLSRKEKMPFKINYLNNL